jgi:phage gpG-like protein
MPDMRRQMSLEEAGVELRQVGDQQRDTTDLIKVLGVAIASDAKQNFEQGAGPDGVGWPPLAHRRADGFSGKPLRDTGLLFASVTSKGAGHVENLGATSLVYGTNRPGANLQQEGGTVRPKGHPFLAIPAIPEAKEAGSPRNFPAPLVGIYGNRGGILVTAMRSRRDRRRGAARAPTIRGSKVQPVLTIAYYLARSVTIPARPFLGFGERLLGKVGLICQDWMTRYWGGGPKQEGGG